MNLVALSPSQANELKIDSGFLCDGDESLMIDLSNLICYTSLKDLSPH